MDEVKDALTELFAEKLEREAKRLAANPPPLFPARLDETMENIWGLIGGARLPELKVASGDGLEQASKEAHALYLEGLKRGSGGREGIIAALEIVRLALQKTPEALVLCEPLWQAARAMRWAAEGVLHPALQFDKPQNRNREPLRHEFRVRCALAVWACREADMENPEELVCKSAAQTSKQFFRKKGGLTVATAARYAKDFRADAALLADSSRRLVLLSLSAWHRDTPADERSQILRWRAEVALGCLLPENIHRDIDTVAARTIGLVRHPPPKRTG